MSPTKTVERLLIVEDNEQMRRALCSFVSDLVGEVACCADGSEACELYGEFLPEWVLMDIQMSGMDGLAATRKIISHYPEANVMIVTDYDDADLRRAAREAGAREYVNKANLLDVRRVLLKRDWH